MKARQNGPADISVLPHKVEKYFGLVSSEPAIQMPTECDFSVYKSCPK